MSGDAIPAGEYRFAGHVIVIRQPISLAKPIRASDVAVDGVDAVPGEPIPSPLVEFIRARGWESAA